MTGRVVHFEIPADDLERAQAFYRDAFGWGINAMPEMDYTLVSTGPVDDQGMPTEPGFTNGGMLARQEPVTAPVIVVDVDAIDAALKTVESLGGSVVQGRQAVGDMGFAAYVRDSEGNMLGLWQSAG
jgi:predicted enzyme related to lactoylglutathione lyase